MNKKQQKRIDFYISLKGNRLYLETPEYNKVKLKIDITSVWHFVKEVIEHPKNDTLLTKDSNRE